MSIPAPPELRDQSYSFGTKEFRSNVGDDAGCEDESDIGNVNVVGSAECVGMESRDGSAHRRTCLPVIKLRYISEKQT